MTRRIKEAARPTEGATHPPWPLPSADFNRHADGADVFTAQVPPPSYNDLLRQAEPPMAHRPALLPPLSRLRPPPTAARFAPS